MNIHVSPSATIQLLIGLAVSLTLSPSFAAEPTRASVAARAAQEFRTQAAGQHADSADVEAFVLSLGDDDLVQNSVSDLLDDFNAALETRSRFVWTRDLSSSEFRRFVLPARVNNEPLQRYRRRFMEDLSDAVRECKTAEAAALEVNLWLGQRVTFRPTDRREQGPLTTLSCGFGRCGEETVIAVAALRSVGLAARMIYVPYWAHHDNNHAWVEAKTADGWKYLGACEPEAVLNHAWFDQPVLRAPILLARAANLDTTESRVVRGNRGWQINTTANYVNPAVLNVSFPSNWSDSDQVWFAVFNFGGIRPIVRLYPKDCQASLDVGAGDFLLIGSFRGELFIQQVSTRQGANIQMTIDPSVGLPDDLTLRYPEYDVSTVAETSAIWQCRLDKGRTQLALSDISKRSVPDWLPGMIVNDDSVLAELFKRMQNAPGNGETLRREYLRLLPEERSLYLELLATLSEKDLREVDSLILRDWLAGAAHALARANPLPDSLRRYVISPRIGWEQPRVWRLFLDSLDMPNAKTNLEKAEYVNHYVAKRIASVRPMRPVDPWTAWRAGKINVRTAAALACGMLRCSGIPSYIAPGEDWVTFFDGNRLLPLYPAQPDSIGIPAESAVDRFGRPASLSLVFPDKVSDVEWQRDFDVVRLNEGWLDEEIEPVLDLKASDSSLALTMLPGDYLLTWGRRNSRGDARLGARRISLVPEKQTTISVALRSPMDEILQTGSSRSISRQTRLLKNASVSLEDTLKQKPGFIFVMASLHEPSYRMAEIARTMASDTNSVIILSGPEENAGTAEASREFLSALEFPTENAVFRRNAPYYAWIDRDGKIIFSGNGYHLNFDAELKSALRSAQ